MTNPDPNAALDGVAIIGMAGRFPGARDIDALWQNLLAGVESISRFERAELEAPAADRPDVRDDPRYVPARGILDGVELFDAGFFGINPKEAQILDPQQRLFLEAAWEALERAGYDPASAGGPVGVFAGMSNNSYAAANLAGHPDLVELVGTLQTMMGNEKDYLATRVSYKLNLTGPSLSIQTACSTSLVAVCQAVQSLLAYQCDMALAGGVSITLPQQQGYVCQDGGITSSDGHCRAFDAAAEGTVFSNGLGVVVLKRLSDAIADGDHVCAVIKGTALNNDGSAKVSFLAPSVNGHADAVAMAQAFARVDPRTVSYVEAHGTGTALGDVVEIAALSSAFRSHTADRRFCALGSLKTNIGHLDAAAGVAGLIKTTLALQHRVIPPTLHFTSPNPKLSLDGSPFFVNTSPLAWPDGPTPRRAGVSSLGVGGTNAHVVLEEAPAVERSMDGRNREVLVVSARTASALDRATGNLRDYLERHPDVPLADVAYTLQTGRRRFSHRRAIVCTDRRDALDALTEYSPRRVMTGDPAKEDSVVAFEFPGSITAAAGCARELYEQESVYRTAVEECAAAFRRHLGVDVCQLLYLSLDPSHAAVPDLARNVSTAGCAHPMLFTIEYALARLWMHWGISPATVAGSGVGELVAATIAGVFPLDVAAMLAAARARLAGSPTEFTEGERLLATMAARDCTPPAVPIAVEGEWISAERIIDPAYWSGRIRRTAAPGNAMPSYLMASPVARLTIGPPAPVMRAPAPGRAIDTSLATLHEGRSDIESMSEALAQLWIQGVDVDWRAFHEGERRLRVPLPTYPFERERYWVDPVPAATRPAAVADGGPAQTSAGNRTDVVVQAADEADVTMRLVTLFGELSGLPEQQLIPSANFFELGLDSLFLTQAASSIWKTFRVKITFRELLEELNTIGAIARRLVERMPVSPVVARGGAPTANAGEDVRSNEGPRPATASSGSVEQILEQLEVMRAQLERLRQAPAPTTVSRRAPVVVASAPAESAPAVPSRGFGPYRPVEKGATGGLTPLQRRSLDTFLERYTTRTRESKRLTGAHRRRLADPRTVAGFRAMWKELVYPIVSVRSAGSRLWDVDGNEYIDLVNGFGTNLFGHSPQFVTEAVEAQLKRGIEIGPQSELAGPVAALATEMTGHERVAFCNTGSEAVTAAIRMARTVTGRDTIAMFAGAYHGTFDEVLARGTSARGELRSVPIAPGVPASACENILVLEYGHPSALEILRSHGADLAAVLVEPVQSRRPELQPIKFLRDVRQITKESGAALVFDEVVTGFRVHPAGAQALFGIKPDLATYGKVVGGGLPIGLVAGRREYLDALDGGDWEYGDDSFPAVGMTFFAGTFVRHPLALAAARAVLTHLHAEGPELQRRLNLRTTELVDTLKARAAELGAPVAITHFSSWFCFNFPGDVPLASLFFAYMRSKGVHIWEGRPGFITTAHTEVDLARVVDAFTESIAEMQTAGFLPAAERADAAPVPGAKRGKRPDGGEGWFVPDPDRPGRYLEVSVA